MIKNRLEIIRLEMSAAAGREINQTEFSAFLEIGQAQYNRYANQITQPSLQVAFKLSRKLNRPIEKLFDESPE